MGIWELAAVAVVTTLCSKSEKKQAKHIWVQTWVEKDMANMASVNCKVIWKGIRMLAS